MKTVLITTLSLIASLSFGQESSAAIEMLEGNILFRGYENKIIIGTHPEEGCSYSLSGENVSVTKLDDYFIVKPGNGKTATLIVSENRPNGKALVVRTKEFQISNLPDPSLHWGWTPAGKAVQDQKPLLSCKYVGYFPLPENFNVVSWNVTHNGESFSGVGTDISALTSLIETFTEVTELTITAKVVGGDGIARQIRGTWFVRPSLNEK